MSSPASSLKRKAEEPPQDPSKKTKNTNITSFFGQARPASTTSSAPASSPPISSSPVDSKKPVSKGTLTNGLSELKPEPAGSAAVRKFDKDAWVLKLSDEQRELLQLEINTLHESWLPFLADEIASDSFLKLKKFLKKEVEGGNKVFPPSGDVYSWSRHTPLDTVKAVVIGQDPYHNVNQAHGLCFSVRPPTPAPPSLKNMFKTLKTDYPDFSPPPKNGGLLTPWADNGVLLLNTCLTVRAHQANSHQNQGWERFTQKVIDTVAKERRKGVVFLAWGTPAQKRCSGIGGSDRHIVLKSVHPSPLSASRGFFDCGHFKKANEWLSKRHGEGGEIDWNLNVDPEKAGV